MGQDFDVTRERIRQIEAKALRKLRHPSRSKRLKAFADTYSCSKERHGPIAQWLEPPAHNRLVPGSNLAGPLFFEPAFPYWCAESNPFRKEHWEDR